MNLAPLLLGGLLVAGVVVAGDDHLMQLVKKLHHIGPSNADCPLADESEVAPLAVIHEAIGKLGLDDMRCAELHQRLMSHAPAVHEAVAQSVSARDAQIRAMFAVPFDPAALEQASQALATAQLALAKATAEMHGALRISLTEAERTGFDTARDALLAASESAHAELRHLLDSGALDTGAPNAKSHAQR